MDTLTDQIRPHVDAIVADANGGCLNAKAVISFHKMHVSAPGDNAAKVFCQDAFDVWLDRNSRHEILANMQAT